MTDHTAHNLDPAGPPGTSPGPRRRAPRRRGALRAASRAMLGSLALVAACSKEPAPERRPPQKVGVAPARPLQDAGVAPARPRAIALADLPGLAIERPAWSARDCRLSSVLRARFGRVEVEPCGALARDARPEALSAARACIERAVAAGRPFVYEQAWQGTDSVVVEGFIGVVEGGKLVTYRASHDNDPCGGDCPERGHTTLYRCGSLVVPPTLEDCLPHMDICYGCLDEVQIDKCVFGGKPP